MPVGSCVVSALLLFVPGDPHGLVAGAVGRRPRGVRARCAARGLRGGGLRGVLLVGTGVASSPPQVTVNNIQVGFLAFAAGILLCVPTAYILASNGANIGQAAGLFAAVGQQPKFYGLILPHGLLELSAIVVAGAAGLAVGWAIIDPGDRTRTAALAEQGRRSAVIVLGLALAFVVAGTIEGFVTPSGLPTSMRVAIGVAACTAFWTYVIVLGRRAAAEGYTGAFGEHEQIERDRARAATSQRRAGSVRSDFVHRRRSTARRWP